MESQPVAPEASATHGLYERHAAKIHGYCLHQLGSREEAEDAVQTTFMNAFRALGRGVVPEAEAAWLFKIAENVCLSRRRSSWRRNRIESPADFEVIEEVVPGPNRQRDELIGIEDALAAMPGQQRRAILLREWQGLSYSEISAELELSQSAVETLIFRARRSLAQGLTEPKHVRPQRRFRRALHLADLTTVLAAAKSLFLGSAALKATTAAVVVTAAAGTAVTVSHSETQSPPKPPLAVSALPLLPPSTPVAAVASTAPPAALLPAKSVPNVKKERRVARPMPERKAARTEEHAKRKAARAEVRAERKAVRLEQRTEQKAARVERRVEQNAARAERRAEQKAAALERRAQRQSEQAARQADRADLRSRRQADKAAQRAERKADQVERRAERQADRGERRAERGGPRKQ